MAKNENPEIQEIKRKLSKSTKHPVLTVYSFKKPAKKQSIYHLFIFEYIVQKCRF